MAASHTNLSIYQLVVEPEQKKFRSWITYRHVFQRAIKPSHATVPLSILLVMRSLHWIPELKQFGMRQHSVSETKSVFIRASIKENINKVKIRHKYKHKFSQHLSLKNCPLYGRWQCVRIIDKKLTGQFENGLQRTLCTVYAGPDYSSSQRGQPNW